MRWGVVAACSWEIAAITTGRVPTITMLCGRHKWLAPAVLAALAAHLYWPVQSRQLSEVT